MQPLIRGQKIKLSDLSSKSQLQVGLAISSPSNLTLDISCFGVDDNNKLSDDRYFIFFNQKTSPCGSLSSLGARNGDQEQFHVDLSRLPSTVRKLVFIVTIDSNGVMSQIRDGYLRLLDQTTELARFSFSSSDFKNEKAIIVGEIYFKDVWRFSAIGQGFNGGLSALLNHFGGEEATTPQAPILSKSVALEKGLEKNAQMTEENKSLDIVGLEPVADSVNSITKATVDDFIPLLNRIWHPATVEEIRLLLKDKVSAWRAKNVVEILIKAQESLETAVELSELVPSLHGQDKRLALHPHPRIIYSIIENGSWVEDDFMQSCWASLLGNRSFLSGGEETLVLINMLSQITARQVELISCICKSAEVIISPTGLLAHKNLVMDTDDLKVFFGIENSNNLVDDSNLDRLDRELDYLRYMGLITGGLSLLDTKACVAPTRIGSDLYYKIRKQPDQTT